MIRQLWFRIFPGNPKIRVKKEIDLVSRHLIHILAVNEFYRYITN